jgi:type IV pilus assembly protein PilO
MKLTTKRKLVLLIALVVVAALILAGFLIYPQFSKISSLDKQITDAQSQIDSARVLLEQRQAVKGRAAQTEAELLRLSNELPESPEIASLIIELQDTANEAGVEFVTLIPSDPVQNAGYSSVPMKMQIRGTWADTLDFMQRVSKLTRQVRIVGYAAQPIPINADSEDDVQRVDLTADLEVYTLASAASAGAAAPTAAQ